uniref:Cytochrome P450 n=1 Tax=Ditylenchus dipsaci TaxID=166011 RepID=A0A915DT43_9BILA
MELFLFAANFFNTFQVYPSNPMDPPTVDKITGFAFSGSIHGVVRTEGKQWREMRRFTTQTLRNLGMGKSGKTGIETKIVTEVDFLIKTLKKAVQSGVQEHNVMELIDVSVGSIITQIMFGYRFSETSRSQFFDLKRTMAQETQMSSQTLCKMNFDQNINKQLGFFDQQISHQIMKRAARATENDDLPPENFVDAFLAKMDISTLRCLCFELYGAGQETTSSTLNFLVLYLMIYPRVQRKLQEELDRVISSARTILSEL